jgi:hypothetical protein
LISPSFHPARIFTVTGIVTARGGVLGLAHQAAPGVVPGDLRHRAAHVDVDDVGAKALHDPRGVGHRRGIAAEDLDRDRPLLLGEFRVLERAIDSAHEALGAHHLGDHKTAPALALHQPAKRGVGHAGHRRDRIRRGEGHVANLHRGTRIRGAHNARTSAAST